MYISSQSPTHHHNLRQVNGNGPVWIYEVPCAIILFLHASRLSLFNLIPGSYTYYVVALSCFFWIRMPVFCLLSGQIVSEWLKWIVQTADWLFKQFTNGIIGLQYVIDFLLLEIWEVSVKHFRGRVHKTGRKWIEEALAKKTTFLLWKIKTPLMRSADDLNLIPETAPGRWSTW